MGSRLEKVDLSSGRIWSSSRVVECRGIVEYSRIVKHRGIVEYRYIVGYRGIVEYGGREVQNSGVVEEYRGVVV